VSNAVPPVLPARTLADLDARSTSGYARPDPTGEVVTAPSSFVVVRPGGGGRPPVAIGDLHLTHLGWRYVRHGGFGTRQPHDGPLRACKSHGPKATDLVLTRREALALGLAGPRQG
jgi:hypothetical protein